MTKRIRYRRLKRGEKRPEGYQYRYKDARGFVPWMAGDDDLYGVKISLHGAADVQFRAPVKPKP